MLYAMRLVGLAMDPFQNSPIAILKDRKETPSEATQESNAAKNAGAGSVAFREGATPAWPQGGVKGHESVHGLQKNEVEQPEGERILPIWIGETEAQSIATELLGIQTPRPLTHDLIKKIILTMGGEIVRVIVTDLIDNTFFAAIEIKLSNGKLETMDARPSDALALALRFRADIFVESKVMDKAIQNESTDSHISSEEIRQWDDQQWEDMVKHWSNPTVARYEQ